MLAACLKTRSFDTMPADSISDPEAVDRVFYVRHPSVEIRFYAKVSMHMREISSFTDKEHVGALWQRGLLNPGMNEEVIRMVYGATVDHIHLGAGELSRLRDYVYRRGAEYFFLKYKAWLMDISSVKKSGDNEVLKVWEQALLLNRNEEQMWRKSRFIFTLSAEIQHTIHRIVLENRPPQFEYAFEVLEVADPTPEVLSIAERVYKHLNPTDPENFDYMHSIALLTTFIEHFSDGDHLSLACILRDRIVARELVLPLDMVEHIIKVLDRFQTTIILVVPPSL